MTAPADRVRLAVNVTLRSPFLFRGLSGSALGIDAGPLTDPWSGRAILPADQLRGILREAVGDLALAGAIIAGARVEAGWIDDVFGRESAAESSDGAANEPARGRLIFADLTATSDRAAIEHVRVEIDDQTGAVETGKLQIVELVAPLGAEVTFAGELILFCPNEADERRAVAVLDRAIKLVGAIGSAKSAGFGEVMSAAIRAEPGGRSRPALPRAASRPADRVTVEARFDRPFLVDASRVADNAFRGAAVLPGGVVKGALAAALVRYGFDAQASDALAGLRVSHGFPVGRQGGLLGRALPLSLVAAKSDAGVVFADILDLPDGKGALLDGRPALHVGDWKSNWFAKAACRLGRPAEETPADLARTHTAIDGETGIADDQRLFTTIARAHRRPDGEPWRFRLSFDAGALSELQRDEARRMIAFALAEGLDGVGKTGARLTFTPVEDDVPAPRALAARPGRFALMLETPALMLDANGAIGADGRWRPGGSRPAYQAYFSTVLPGAVLHGFFAAQHYVGGYWSRRFRAFGASVYHPFLLTEAGAIFEIETDDIEGLARLLRFGLPVAPQTGATGPLDWRNCPFVPENGYGTVSCDHLGPRFRADRAIEFV